MKNLINTNSPNYFEIDNIKKMLQQAFIEELLNKANPKDSQKIYNEIYLDYMLYGECVSDIAIRYSRKEKDIYNIIERTTKKLITYISTNNIKREI